MTDPNDSRRSLPDIEPWEYDPDDDAPPSDELFRVLADATRRRTLWLLLERQRTTLDELADTLIGWRAEERDVVGPDERERIVLALSHVHLPMLRDSGLVAHDADGGKIRLSSPAEPVRELIRSGYRYERTVDAADTP
jgi:DNA-binding transcriptional ArsR family regulator